MTSRVAFIILMTSILAACESGPRPTQVPETDLVGTPPKEAPRQMSSVESESETTPVEEEVRVELVMLELGNPYMTDTGVKVSLESTDPIQISMQSAAETRVVDVPVGTVYAEGEVFGSVWSLDAGDSLHLELRHDPPPRLTDAQARQIATQELDANLGCEGEDRKVDAAPGTVRFERVLEGKVACSAQVGLFTGRVVVP